MKILLFLGMMLSVPDTYPLTVEFRGIKVNRGGVLLARLKTDKKIVVKEMKIPVTASNMTVVFGEFPKGRYSVEMFHDQNQNNKLDTNFLGIPKEGWGVSNDARGVMSAPKFEDTLFPIQANTKITINLSYF